MLVHFPKPRIRIMTCEEAAAPFVAEAARQKTLPVAERRALRKLHKAVLALGKAGDAFDEAGLDEMTERADELHGRLCDLMWAAGVTAFVSSK